MISPAEELDGQVGAVPFPLKLYIEAPVAFSFVSCEGKEGHCVYCGCCRQWLTPVSGAPRAERPARQRFLAGV